MCYSLPLLLRLHPRSWHARFVPCQRPPFLLVSTASSTYLTSILCGVESLAVPLEDTSSISPRNATSHGKSRQILRSSWNHANAMCSSLKRKKPQPEARTWKCAVKTKRKSTGSALCIRKRPRSRKSCRQRLYRFPIPDPMHITSANIKSQKEKEDLEEILTELELVDEEEKVP
jgi:hypothetical protein